MAEVVVAGAGPVGLMLACELALAGVRVTVLERRTEIDPTIKAGSLNAPTIEALDRRGLTPALRAAAEQTMAAIAAFRGNGGSGSGPARKFAGHFGGIMLDADHLAPDDPGLASAARLGGLAIVSQQQLEAILGERARELGVDLRRGVTITGFTEQDGGVVVHTQGGAHAQGARAQGGAHSQGSAHAQGAHAQGGAHSQGSAHTQSARAQGGEVHAEGAEVRAGWLVGCDGGRSIVRKLAGFEFPGTDPEITAYQALAELAGTDGLRPGWHATDTGVYSFGPVPGRVLVAEFAAPPADRDAPVTPAELQAAIRRVTGVDVEVRGIRTVTRFTDNARQASTYRRGRVLLAGDAAHVHSPFGGQGLNLGIGDAMNLGWKLAATVRGWAPAGLLDSYTAERHPIGAWVLDWTRAQIAIMRPDRHARALRQVLADLAGTTDGATYLAGRIAGAWQAYDLPGDHPLTGRPALDLDLSDGSRLAGRLHDGRALLVNAKADGYEDRLTQVTADGAPRMLVRPDGYVAWAGDDEEPAEADLARWLGAPTCSR